MSRLTELRLYEPALLADATSPVGRRHHLAGKPSNHRHTPENFARRFWAKVDRSRGSAACWPWLGSKIEATGRGQVHLRWEGKNNVRRYAPVVAWVLTHGEIPDGLRVCHNCPAGDDPNCCNPNHLFLGTQRENILDSIRKGRFNAFGRQKLNATQVREIRARWAAGELQRTIAADFGIARHTVSGIVHRHSWNHLDAPNLERVPSVQLDIRGEVA